MTTPRSRAAFAELCERQAELMLTTERVGDPEEDASMKKARPALARINGIGLLTHDSQMGVKRKRHWQRAYVSGIATRETAARIAEELGTVDSVLVLTSPHGDSAPDALEDYAVAHMPRLPLTLQGADLRDAVTGQPLGWSPSFSYVWNNSLPELLAELKRDMTPARLRALRAQCQRETVQVFIVDTVWGRPTWLFDTILRRCRP